jgi:uncharacterized protein (UPF0332 family)
MDERRVSLAKYRLDKANENLESAKISFNENLFRSAISNSYYSIFHTIRVLFALEGFDSKTHKGAIHLLNNHFIKSGLLPISISEILTDSFEMRIDSDYEDFFIVSKDDALRQIENAKFLINEIIQFVKKYYGIEL